ncbi:hypothetical protein [Halobiforma nitratireducens]|uniref:Uncharacterized protein n=1 Tax=Halobiforma nitratireducens JCM 10879 TaxID=1227454 RepID=M0LRR2_9EURY|nr:hypothetical protein [Halobiforma nitratireducens]EMA35119.1 hypothetical protein C446_13214 [Halobiforma nitratireducens JCM 10879]
MCVTAAVPLEQLLEGSNGRYYTAWQVRRRLRIGDWRRCLRQRQPERHLVETDDGGLLMLTPVEPADAPRWLEVRIVGDAEVAIDTRRRSGTAREAVSPRRI